MERYNVTWTCPECGNSHNWWWEEEDEAYSEDACVMNCDRCGENTWCEGNGNGYYTPIEEEMKAKTQRDLDAINSTLDELQNSRKMQLSLVKNLTSKVNDLESLENDLHNYYRELETKFNKNDRDLRNAINALGGRLIEYEQMNDNLARRTTEAELAIWRLENGIKPGTSPKKDTGPSAEDICFGVKPSFPERFREGCGFTKEELLPDELGAILLFIAVEVERMTERDMGGTFTVSNLKVGERLRELAAEARLEDG